MSTSASELRRYAAGVALAAFALSAAAQEIAVPVATHVAILSRALELDRKLGSPGATTFTVCILFQSGLRESSETARLAKEAFISAGKVKGLPIRVAPVDLDSGARLEAVLSGGRADVVYVCPLRSISADVITKVTRSAKALSLTGVPALVERGIALGVDLRAGKPEILLNLAGAEAEGAEFAAELVKVARIIR